MKDCPIARQINGEGLFKRLWVFVVLCGLSLMNTSKVSAASFNVADGDVTGLISAINLANGNSEADTINLAPGGTYVLTTADNLSNGANGLPVITSQINLLGHDSLIERFVSGPDFRFIYVSDGGLLILDTIHFKDGLDTSIYGGGAILLGGTGSIHLSSCSFEENSARWTGGGGAILTANYSHLFIKNSQFINNHSVDEGSGGALRARVNSSIEVDSSLFDGNAAEHLGGAIQNDGYLKLINSKIINNITFNNGGGIFNRIGTVEILKTLISGNKVTKSMYGQGGAVMNDQGTVTIEGSVIETNSSPVQGGGIYSRASTSVRGSCISGNSATSVVNEASAPILEAIDNWWGDSSGPSGVGPGSGDSVSSNVNYTPFSVSDECPVELYDSYDVPFYSQRDPEWKDHTYDYADSWIPAADPDTTIETWGCGLSSVAMLLNYFGITTLPDGTTLNPDTLNVWFNAQVDGHWREGATPWGAASRLTKIMSDQNQTTKLEYHKIEDVNNNYSLSDLIFAQSDVPHIMELKEADSASGVHFVVTNGVIKPSQKYSILDPYNGIKKLLATESGLVSLRVFEPTNSNFSYLFVHLDKGVEAILNDELNEKVGFDGSKHTDQPGAWYDWQLPLAADGADTNSGVGFTELAVPTPHDGHYYLSLTADVSGLYKFELYVYDIDSNPNVVEKEVFIDTDEPLVYEFVYSQDNGLEEPDVKHQPTFGRLKKMIDYAYNQGWMDNYSHKRFIKEVEQTEKYLRKPKKLDLAIRNLQTLKLIAQIFTNLRITPEARDFIVPEIDFVIDWLKSPV